MKLCVTEKAGRTPSGSAATPRRYRVDFSVFQSVRSVKRRVLVVAARSAATCIKTMTYFYGYY